MIHDKCCLPNIIYHDDVTNRQAIDFCSENISAEIESMYYIRKMFEWAHDKISSSSMFAHTETCFHNWFVFVAGSELKVEMFVKPMRDYENLFHRTLNSIAHRNVSWSDPLPTEKICCSMNISEHLCLRFWFRVSANSWCLIRCC